MGQTRIPFVRVGLVLAGIVGVVVYVAPLQLPAVLRVGGVNLQMPDLPVGIFEFQSELDPATEILIMQQAEPVLLPDQFPLSELESVFASQLFEVPEAEQYSVIEVKAAHILAVQQAIHEQANDPATHGLRICRVP